MRLRRPAAPVLPAIAAVRGVLLVTAGACASLGDPAMPARWRLTS